MGLAVKVRIIAAVLLCFTAVAAQNHRTVTTTLRLLNFTEVEAYNLGNFTATLGPFSENYYSIFRLKNGATINNNGALQLTPNSAYERRLVGMPLENQAGRAMFKVPFKLSEQVYKYNKTKDRVASFNSSFLFSVCPLGLNTTPGEGLAFIIVPPHYGSDSFLSKSFGQYLGLTNVDTDGYATDAYGSLVAIEFDNVKQAFDPDANHVGLNINSIISTVTASLTPLGIELAPDGEDRFYNVWVQYDGVSKVIEVYIARQAGLDGETPSRPDTPVLKSNLDLGVVFENYEHLNFGFSASTGNNVQLNCIFRWNLTVESFVEEFPPREKTPKLLKTLLVVGVGVPLLVIGVVVMGYYYPCKKRSMVQFKSNILLGVSKRLGLVQFNSNILLGALKRLPGTPREFRFKDLKRATNNFDEKNKLGQGGFGVVYRGHLHDENLDVAVKWFSRETIKGEDDFLAELTIINRLRHKHLVRLLGWCHKNGKLLLVYDYMSNGSLDAHLFTKTPDSKPLSWDQRYNIISGVASALNYLHNEYDQRVVHRDLKASNIMLDSYFNARLGDFGLARALDEEKTSYSEVEGVAGTLGYIAPECFLTGKATQQSDVYAFGVVLLEIVCGLRPGTRIDEFHFLVDWVWSLHREGRILDAVEERLGDEYVVEEAQKVLVLALACSHPIARERPRTQAIVHIISGLVPVPYVPPFKPAVVWASMPSLEEDDISSLASMTEAKSFPTTHLGSGFTTQCISRELYTGDNFKFV
ncbi:probable L-type lectin-domain containing receptor kinase S.5 [Rhododendron vialii]|uniref:probable L-type lectin-domain containing receptor kinase S.5 n=1 Tax=Rhododendron vialii TaxID=182163 RepID=UPI00265DDBED|nr:probable L-type lectin-domain containing receptor kinase S.5 [Rhododendron vialii]